MKRIHKRILTLAAVLAAAALVAGLWSLHRALQRVDAELDRQVHPTFPTISLSTAYRADLFAPLHPQIRWFSNAGRVHDLIDVPGGVLAATDGGLIFARKGMPLRRAGKPTGFPFSSAFRILRQGDRLVVVGRSGLARLEPPGPGGVRAAHLYTFGLAPSDRLVDAVVQAQDLFVLTLKGEVLRCRQARCERLGAVPKGLPSVLAVDRDRFFVGTFEGELHVLRLAGNRIKAGLVPGLEGAGAIRTLAVHKGRLWIGAADGLFVMEEGRAIPVRRGLFVTALTPEENGLWVGTFSGGLYHFESDAPLPSGPSRPLLRLPEPIFALRPGAGGLLLGSDAGPFRVIMREDGIFALPLIKPAGLGPIPENYVTALAFDRGSLLVGGLNTGLVRLDPVTGESLAIAPDAPGVSDVAPLAFGLFAVGATTGYMEIDADGKTRRHLTRRQGLIHDNVTAVLPRPGRVFAATAAGLSLIEGARVRSIYAFHGLVNNHLYALAPAGPDVWVGTLGGLCRVGGPSGLTVLRCITEKDGLTHPWVSALLNHSGRLYVGTYGGGVMVVEPDGSLARLAGAPNTSINLNAACSAGPFACFGSLEHGLLLADRHDKLEAFTFGLPSTNVTALAGDDNRLAVGTDVGVVVFPIDLLSRDEPQP